MGATRTRQAPEAPDPAAVFRPHRRWYRRPGVVVPVALVVIGYALLAGAVQEPGSYAPEVYPDGDLRFDWNFFVYLVPMMLTGLLVTAKATLWGFAAALVLGFLLALGRRSRRAWVRWPVTAGIEFVRSTPLLVQLFFWQASVRAVDWIALQPLEILTLGLGIHYATYCSEAYRAGINSVPAGQWEAATSLSLGPVTTWTRVIIPQAVPNVLPALGNYLVAAFKDAPMGFIVNVHGLLFFANSIRDTAFRPVEPYLLAGLGFLLVSIPAAWAVRLLEKRISYERI
ncbi:ectoine/hydroxyectoine ABC transporter permease subunit EhuD [Myceligenerans crystallogenes]|uniref:Ectoine/hydroxyectoine ABC transporter permease subunit EhuD n=1 Tax=Myceligenerans crystallogenes TaxID=316335 RepID=A0ABN2NLL7_9MICO